MLLFFICFRFKHFYFVVFQEYMNKIYTTTLVLPDVEAEILEIDRQTGKTESRWSMSPQIKDEEDSHDGQRIYFENLQMSLHIW